MAWKENVVYYLLNSKIYNVDTLELEKEEKMPK